MGAEVSELNNHKQELSKQEKKNEIFVFIRLFFIHIQWAPRYDLGRHKPAHI